MKTKRAAKTKTPTVTVKTDPPGAVALQAAIVLEASRLGLVPLSTAGTAAILEIVDNLTPAAYEAMRTLAVRDPDVFLKHYLNMAEFKLPKLARVEHKVDGDVEHRHFVAVEQRDPPTLVGPTAPALLPAQ